MAIYSVGRRRVIVALLLTSALLLTLDLRGNPVVDRARDAMAVVIGPIDTAVGVVATPVERAWNGIANYDDLENENEALQEEVDRLIGTQVSGEAAVLQAQEILALNNLPALAGIPTELAQVVGGAANNIDQIIEINKGQRSGIEVGMPVVNQAGLIGKVTTVTETSARVMLVTDPRYAVGVTVTAALDETAASNGTGDASVNTSPSGLTPEQIDEAANPSTTTTSTTVPAGTSSGPPSGPTTTAAGSGSPTGPPTPDTTLPGASAESIPSFVDPVTGEPIPPEVLTALAEQEAAAAAAAAAEATAAGNTTTTTEPVVVRKEYGSLEGRGRRLLPQIRFVQDNPSLAELQVGDLVETAGGSESLAPPGIPVGRVANRADRPGSGGPLLDVELNADLTRLNFVRVVIYKPLSEVEQ
ncbi:MAG: rod shape-determining protein MreC [Ilumatobacteraceae bacterium]